MHALALASLLCFSAPLANGASPGVDDPGAHQWNQPRGGPTCDSTNDVAPVRSQPKELWRLEVNDTLLGEPVAWGNVVFALVKRIKDVRVVAIDLATGKTVTSSTKVEIDDEKHAYLACWEGFVAVVASPALRFFTYRGQFSALNESWPGKWTSPPTVHEGYLFACSRATGLTMFDIRTGKKLAETSDCIGQPGVLASSADRKWKVATLVLSDASIKDIGKVKIVGVRVSRVVWTDTGASLTSPEPDWHAPFVRRDLSSNFLVDGFVAPLPAVGEMKEPTWFFWTPERLMAEKSAQTFAGVLPRALAPIITIPGVHSGWAIGFSSESEVLRFRGDGKFQIVARLPSPQHRQGRMSAARDVLYFENWAVEAESGVVLWSDPKLEPLSALLPVADGKLLYVAKDDTLVCLGESSAAAPTANASKRATAATTNASDARPTRPGSGEGLVLANGQRRAGSASVLPDGRIELENAKGETSSFAPADVALLELADGARLVGDESAVYRAAWAAERFDAHADLEQVFEAYLTRNLIGECERLSAELRRLDLDDSRRDKLTRKLAGRKELTGPAVRAQTAQAREVEDGARERRCKSIVASARWLSKHGMRLAASTLLGRAEELAPARDDVRELALALAPAGFALPDASKRPAAWMKLAEAMLPVAGEVVPPDDPAATKKRVAPWDANVLLLRSRNILLLSRDSDPAIVGECLRHAERTVRVLARELGSPAGASAGDGRLEVRLHANREQYLADQSAGGVPPEWTSGFFSPTDGISRFYVPHDQTHHDPLERALFEVLAHEVTHQWISVRWLGSERKPATGDAKRPGYWIVEGFARFIEDQIVGAGDELRIDDEAANSVDVSARILGEDRLMPLAELLDLDQIGFWKLSKEPLALVQPRRLMRRAEINATNRFYEQGGALAFMLVNHAERRKRELLFQYLKDWYAGRLELESWKQLGYADAAQLETEFRAFLARH